MITVDGVNAKMGIFHENTSLAVDSEIFYIKLWKVNVLNNSESENKNYNIKSIKKLHVERFMV